MWLASAGIVLVVAAISFFALVVARGFDRGSNERDVKSWTKAEKPLDYASLKKDGERYGGIESDVGAGKVVAKTMAAQAGR